MIQPLGKLSELVPLVELLQPDINVFLQNNTNPPQNYKIQKE